MLNQNTVSFFNFLLIVFLPLSCHCQFFSLQVFALSHCKHLQKCCWLLPFLFSQYFMDTPKKCPSQQASQPASDAKFSEDKKRNIYNQQKISIFMGPADPMTRVWSFVWTSSGDMPRGTSNMQYKIFISPRKISHFATIFAMQNGACLGQLFALFFNRANKRTKQNSVLKKK